MVQDDCAPSTSKPCPLPGAEAAPGARSLPVRRSMAVVDFVTGAGSISSSSWKAAREVPEACAACMLLGLAWGADARARRPACHAAKFERCTGDPGEGCDAAALGCCCYINMPVVEGPCQTICTMGAKLCRHILKQLAGALGASP